MKLSLVIDTGNVAFTDNPDGESVDALRAVADRIRSGERDGVIKDYNGNTVGRWDLSAD